MDIFDFDLEHQRDFINRTIESQSQYFGQTAIEYGLNYKMEWLKSNFTMGEYAFVILFVGEDEYNLDKRYCLTFYPEVFVMLNSITMKEICNDAKILLMEEQDVKN